MKGQIISFRLSMPALANGLVAIRRFEPNYQPTSIHKMVQLIYYDYCSKMSMGHTDAIPEDIMTEILMLIPGEKKRIPAEKDKNILAKLDGLNLQSAQPTSGLSPTAPANEPTNVSNRSSGLTEDIVTESQNSTVQDFSFLKTLGDDEEDNDE